MMKAQISLLLGIFLCFASGSSYGQTLHLTTENYPPFNMNIAGRDSAKEDQITGISTEIVQELFKRAEIGYTMTLYPWKRAYWLAKNRSNYGVFSTTRTEAREPLFKWVGPLVTNNWIFLAKKERKIKINSLEDARKYRIGGYEGDAVALYLQNQGFKLNLTIADHYNALLIDKNRIDLWATGQLLGPYFAKRAGVSGLEEVFMFKETIMSIAFNKSVPEETINQLNEVLQQMRKDGTIETINQRY